MKYKNIIVKKESEICYITINRPNDLNALNKKTIQELNQTILELGGDNLTRCIILTGSGSRAFVAGADIKEFAKYNKEQGEQLSRQGQEKLFDLLSNSPIPTIAAINGFALGGGLELAMACHIRIASENAKMGLPEVSLGLIPGYGGSQRLSNLVGKGKALEMITTAKMITSLEAKEWGLVNHVVSQEGLITKAEEIAKSIKRNSSMAIKKAIKAVNSSFNFDEDGFEVEKKEFGDCFETDHFKEGTRAFIEKRKANFN